MNLTNPIFTDETKAREHFEAIRWPDGPFCPHCGEVDKVYRLAGKSHRPGLLHCNSCNQAFTVTVGSVMERSHVPLTKWAMAFALMCSSKKGYSAHQLHRTIGVTYKTAWFMAHRIREAMRELAPNAGPTGGDGKTVETDETYVGGKEKNKHASKRKHLGTGGVGKEMVFSLVERQGRIRSRHLADISARNLRPILDEQFAEAAKTTHLMTDGEGQYRLVGPMFASHQVVNHGIGEYVRGNAHTNTVEGYFAILKRGIIGTYHHVSPEHLKRYLAEFDFRYNERTALGVDDTARTLKAIKGADGKRLTYRSPRSATIGATA